MLDTPPKIPGDWGHVPGAWYHCSGVWVFVPEQLPELKPLWQAVDTLLLEINVRNGADQGGT